VHRYSFQDFYIETDGDVVSVYAEDEYVSLAGAETADRIASPPRLDDHGIFIGRIIFQKGDAVAQSILSPFAGLDLSGASTSNHNDLSGLDLEDRELDAIPLEWCSCYSILEPRPKRGIEIFCDLVSGHAHFQGLWITGENRKDFITNNNLSKIQGYQFFSEKQDGFIEPDLQEINWLINEFLSSNLHSVIYFDSLNILIVKNGIENVLKFCNNVKDSIVMNDSIIITSINQEKYEKETLNELLNNSINITEVDVIFEDLMKGIY